LDTKIDTLEAKVDEGLASIGLITGNRRQINRRLEGSPVAARRPVAATTSNRDTPRSTTRHRRVASLGEQRAKNESAKRTVLDRLEAEAAWGSVLTRGRAQHKKTRRKHKKKSRKRTKKRNSKKSRRRR
jgi:hypothetical protein